MTAPPSYGRRGLFFLNNTKIKSDSLFVSAQTLIIHIIHTGNLLPTLPTLLLVYSKLSTLLPRLLPNLCRHVKRSAARELSGLCQSSIPSSTFRVGGPVQPCWHKVLPQKKSVTQHPEQGNKFGQENVPIPT